jgi:ElaB/YqjD/DUF883 family membrane-anchored ribosome-binding protein
MSSNNESLGREIRRESNANDPATLERRSDAIRADVGQTLDALQRNYSPGALLDRSIDLFKEHGGELGANLGRSVKQNPVPALLTLVGIGWMMVSQNRQSSDGYREYDHEPYDDEDAYLDEDVYLADTSIGPRDGEMPGESEGDNEGVKEKLRAAREKVRDAKDSTRDSMRSARRRLSERSHRAKNRAAYRARRTRDGFERMLDEQPFVIGAVGVALGALIGAVLPESEREDRMLGEARDRALDRAKEIGARGVEQASSGKARQNEGPGAIP